MAQNDFTIYPDQLAQLNGEIQRLIKESDAKCAMVVGKDGRTVAKQGFTRTMDTASLGALVAGSFASTNEIARLLGEPEFTMMFHQGKHDHVHISLVDDKTLLVITFDERTTIGMIRLVAKEITINLAQTMRDIYLNKPDVEEFDDSFDNMLESKLDDILGGKEE